MTLESNSPNEQSPRQVTIALPVYGIRIVVNGLGGGLITSDLHVCSNPDDPPEWDAAFDAIESLILAHACAGVDITSPAYVEGIVTAVEAVISNL